MGEVDGQHAMVIVGYNDTAQTWTVRNSWGTSILKVTCNGAAI